MSNTFLLRLAFCGKAPYNKGMNDLQSSDLTEKIIQKLLSGENPDNIQKQFSCELSLVYQILGSGVFSERICEYLQRDIQISGIIAIKNIKEIAGKTDISQATRLKANQWIAEKALELNRLGVDSDSPATMTQDQLARRLKALQDEAIKRAKPIDTGVIEVNLDNMME